MKTKKILFLSILFFAFMFFSFFTWLYYSGRVNTYQPITIKNANNEKVDFKVYGTTPLGRVFSFIQRDSFKVSCYYSFCRQIEVRFQASNDIVKHNIIVEIGNTSYHYQIIGNNSFIKPIKDRGNIGYWGALFSVFQWTITKLLIKFIFPFAIILLIIINRRKILLLWILLKKYFNYFILIPKQYSKISLLYIFLSIVSSIIMGVLYKYHYEYVFLGYYLIIILFVFIYILTLLIYKMIRIRKNRENIKLLISTMMLSLIVIEFIIRLSGTTTTNSEKRSGFYQSLYIPTESGWYHIWAVDNIHYIKTSEYNYERKTNSLGLSDKEPPIKKDSNEYRIIGLGDSYTEGDGANEDSTWLKFLERNVKGKYDKNIRFINAGVCGSDPYFEYVLLRDKLICYKPDLVILAINDEITDIMVRGGIERFKSNGKLQFVKPPKWEWLFSISHIFRLIVNNVMRYDQMLISPYQFPERYKRALEQYKESLLLFKSLSDKEGFKLLVVMHPLQNEIESKSFRYLSKVEQYAKKNKIQTLNMLDYYINHLNITKENAGKYYWNIDRHHNANGYSAFASGVEWKLKEMGIINKKTKD